jgi:DNA-directed RNA polymerase subunit RPC12/RpoP
MSEKIFELSIPVDDEGYVTFECPYCGIRFKLEAEEFEASSILDLYCPACGLVNEINSFYTSEVIVKAEEIAMNYAIDMINKMFKDLERGSRNNKFIKFKSNRIKKEYGTELYENVDELEITGLNCCSKTVKVRLLDRYIGIYCPYCGGR